MTQRTIRTATDEQISDVVFEALAAAKGSDPCDLPKLYEVIDLDALDRLVRRDDDRQHTDVRVEFAIADCVVKVEADGRVVVVPSHSGPTSQTAST